MASGQTVLNVFDIANTKVGANQKEKGYVIKSKGVGKICTIFCVLVLFTMGVFFNQHWEVHVLRRSFSDQEKSVNVMAATTSARLVDTETELKQVYESTLADRRAAGDLEGATGDVVKRLVHESEQYLRQQSQVLLQSWEHAIDTELTKPTGVLSRLDVAAAKKNLKHIARDRVGAFSGEWLTTNTNNLNQILDIVAEHTAESELHAEVAQERLKKVNSNLARDALTAAHANSELKEQVEQVMADDDEEMDEEELVEMIEAFFQQANDRLKAEADLFMMGYEMASIDEQTNVLLLNLLQQMQKAENDKIEEPQWEKLESDTITQLQKLIKRQVIPPPNNYNMDIVTYLEELTDPKIRETRMKQVKETVETYQSRWNNQDIDADEMFKVIQQLVSKGTVPARWLFIDDDIEELERSERSSAARNVNHMDEDEDEGEQTDDSNNNNNDNSNNEKKNNNNNNIVNEETGKKEATGQNKNADDNTDKVRGDNTNNEGDNNNKNESESEKNRQISAMLKAMMVQVENGKMTKQELYQRVSSMYEDGEIPFEIMKNVQNSLGQFATETDSDLAPPADNENKG